MFSKSKRFPEVTIATNYIIKPCLFIKNTSGDKDYIPGPGEYDLSNDDAGKNKRYGFLNQSSRFNENTPPPTDVSFPYDYYDGPNLSSISTDTGVSSVSSNRTTEDTKLTYSSTSKNNPFEKYRYAMQKEIEALQAKGRKMEAAILSLETDRNTSKGVLLEKDQELAELRSKNNSLQKTVTRLEKTTKVNQLTKKVEQLEETLRTRQQEHETQVQEKNQMIGQLEEELKMSGITISELKSTALKHQTEYVALEMQLITTKEQLDISQKDHVQKQNDIDCLERESQDMLTKQENMLQEHQRCKSDYANHLTQKQSEIEQLDNELRSTQVSLLSANEHLQHLTSQTTLQKQELDRVTNERDESKEMVQQCHVVVEALQSQFKSYRLFMTEVTHDLRTKVDLKCDIHFKELNLLLTELHQAKKFINQQAQFIDSLKSDTHWLKKRNEQLWNIIQEMDNDFVNRCKIFNRFPHDIMDDIVHTSDKTISSSSSSSSSSCSIKSTDLNDQNNHGGDNKLIQGTKPSSSSRATNK
ncbi:hypothetical protein K501DRAFT_297473 [Backusella circina FSU 941]|nr:hypothetical protein K501DRAFT_297473 [Backusella circina FSU 941]